MTLREKIIFVLKETVHVRIDYMSLPKGRFFIMTTTHPIVSNAITDSTTLRIAMLVNPIDKPLKICKGICLSIIHEFTKTIYFLIDVFKVAIALAVATITLSEPLSQVQRDVMLSPRYQYISLSLSAFSNQIVVISAKFILILKIEIDLIYNPFSSAAFNRAILDQADVFSYIPIRSDSSTLFTDIMYTIIERKNII